MDLIEIAIKGGIVASVHIVVTFQAFNGFEQRDFLYAWEGLIVPRTERLRVYSS